MKIDWAAVAAALGLKNAAVASVRFGQIKKRLNWPEKPTETGYVPRSQPTIRRNRGKKQRPIGKGVKARANTTESDGQSSSGDEPVLVETLSLAARHPDIFDAAMARDMSVPGAATYAAWLDGASHEVQLREMAMQGTSPKAMRARAARVRQIQQDEAIVDVDMDDEPAENEENNGGASDGGMYEGGRSSAGQVKGRGR